MDNPGAWGSLAAQVMASFHSGAATAEIGCGSGDHSAWLAREGFAVTAFDTSAALQDATARHPEVTFQAADWPELASVPTAGFRNVLCAGALDQVGREDLITAVFSLARILEPGGRLVLCFSTLPDRALPVGKLMLLCESTGFTMIDHRSLPDSGGTLLVAEKSPLEVARGLERIQRVLVQDRKFATYKYGLVRSLCGIARNEPHVVRWGEGQVYVPLWFVAQRWLIYYWPFFTGPHFIAQRRGEIAGGEKPVAFRSTIERLAQDVGPGGLHRLLADLESDPARYQTALREIAETIRDGPVTHAGTQATPVFGYTRAYPPGSGGMEKPFGWIVVPEAIWLDISRFHHWIEDSLILRWAELTVEMNPRRTVAEILPHLVFSPYQERDTTEVRALLQPQVTDLACVWTGKRLKPEYAVDHVIPFSVWGKRLYYEQMPQRFGQQVERSLGLTVGHTGWERVMFAGFQETVERVAAIAMAIILYFFFQLGPPQYRAVHDRLTHTYVGNPVAATSDARNREIAAWYIRAWLVGCWGIATGPLGGPPGPGAQIPGCARDAMSDPQRHRGGIALDDAPVFIADVQVEAMVWPIHVPGRERRRSTS